MNLPKSFTTVAGKYGIEKENILFAAMADFDADYRFADSIVALAGDKLIFAAYPYREKAEYRFGGYGGWHTDENLSTGQNPGKSLSVRKREKWNDRENWILKNECREDEQGDGSGRRACHTDF